MPLLLARAPVALLKAQFGLVNRINLSQIRFLLGEFGATRALVSRRGLISPGEVVCVAFVKTPSEYSRKSDYIRKAPMLSETGSVGIFAYLAEERLWNL